MFSTLTFSRLFSSAFCFCLSEWKQAEPKGTRNTLIPRDVDQSKHSAGLKNILNVWTECCGNYSNGSVWSRPDVGTFPSVKPQHELIKIRGNHANVWKGFLRLLVLFRLSYGKIFICWLVPPTYSSPSSLSSVLLWGVSEATWSLSPVERQAAAFKLLPRPRGTFMWGFSLGCDNEDHLAQISQTIAVQRPPDRRVDRLAQTWHGEALTMPSEAVPVCVIRLYIPGEDKTTLN